MVGVCYLIKISLARRHLTLRILQFNIKYRRLYLKFISYNQEIFVLLNFLYQIFEVYQDFKGIFNILALNLRDGVA